MTLRWRIVRGGMAAGRGDGGLAGEHWEPHERCSDVWSLCSLGFIMAVKARCGSAVAGTILILVKCRDE